MSEQLSFDRFARIFRANIRARSRTAKGVSDTQSSSKKKKLLKRGDELRAQVEANTETLVQLVWHARDIGMNTLAPQDIRRLMEQWYDAINHGLSDPAFYREDQEKLRAEAERLRAETGIPYRVNSRYRVWTPSYIKLHLQPLEIELAMDAFYEELRASIVEAHGGGSQAELLAYADYMIDSAIHPWADGCGRCATAVVMWLSLLMPGHRLPLFGDREKHYRTIGDLAQHAEYYRWCLGRSLHNGA